MAVTNPAAVRDQSPQSQPRNARIIDTFAVFGNVKHSQDTQDNHPVHHVTSDANTNFRDFPVTCGKTLVSGSLRFAPEIRRVPEWFSRHGL